MYMCSLSVLLGVSGDKIINGKKVKPHSRPYMAYLEINIDEQIYSCGGFLIHPDFILTAAHLNNFNHSMICFSITVHLGVHNILRSEKSQQVIPAEEIIPHECYDDGTIVNDIMLLKLKHSANITHSVKTISVPKRGDDFSLFQCSVAGWGDTKTNGKGSCVLREVNVEVDLVSASQIFYDLLLFFISGDSGGPLVCQDTLNMPTAVGIVSYGPKRCEDPGSNAYTMVSAYWDWIETKIKANYSA
uniref:trypsin n=1 Tax=Erpetoichthys calabaricus TaxID=27687 RepID=A0A8C4XFA6_ERPCA